MQPTLAVSAGQTINYSFLFLGGGSYGTLGTLLKPEAPPIFCVQSMHSACESRQECRSWPPTRRWPSLHFTPLHFSSFDSSTLVCGLWRHAGEYAAQGKSVMISRLPCAPWIRNTTRYFSNPFKPNGKTVTKQFFFFFFLHYYVKKCFHILFIKQIHLRCCWFKLSRNLPLYCYCDKRCVSMWTLVNTFLTIKIKFFFCTPERTVLFFFFLAN